MGSTLKSVGFFILVLSIFIIGCGKDKASENLSVTKNNNIKINKNTEIETSSYIPVEKIVVNDNPDCVQFVALWSAGDISKLIGKDRKWVFLNYTVDLWDTPPTYGAGNIIGKLRASSYARIIATMGEDYKVESPVNQVHGWINKEHVKSISIKNPKTRALCK